MVLQCTLVPRQCPQKHFFNFQSMVHIWQSRAEIKHYPLGILTTLPCSKRCSAVLPLRVGLIHAMWTYQALMQLMSPALNRSSTLQRFERSNADKIHNGIMFDFYPGLPHIHLYVPRTRNVSIFQGALVLNFSISLK